MLATKILSQEHQAILPVLDAAEREAHFIKEHGAIHAEITAQILDFIRHFADHFHHAKEEDLLFVKLQEKGMPSSGPISCMLHEHDEGRAYITSCLEDLPKAKKGDQDACLRIANALESFVALLREHILKEDQILYPMADELLSADDQEALLTDFKRVEAENYEKDALEKFLKTSQKLSKHLT